MELRAAVKKNAKRALSGFWGQAVAIALFLIGCFLMLLILETLLLEFLNLPPYYDIKGTIDNPFDDLADTSPLSFLLLGGGWLLSFLIGTPLSYGAGRWFYLRSGGASPDFGDVFFYFSSLANCLGSLWIQLNLALRQLLWSLIFLAPGCICVLLGGLAKTAAATDGEGLLASGLVVSGIIIGLCGAGLLFIFMQRFALVRYIYFETGSVTSHEHVRLSVRGSRGYRVRLSTFCLSFLGWLFLSAFGLPLLFVMPYFMMAHSIMARLIIAETDLAGQTQQPHRQRDYFNRDEQHSL